MVAYRPTVQLSTTLCHDPIVLERMTVRAERARIVAKLVAFRTMLNMQFAPASRTPVNGGVSIAVWRRLAFRCHRDPLAIMAIAPSPKSP